jgi:23S rRNA (cytosine1962-C5)-methyltransferase
MSSSSRLKIRLTKGSETAIRKGHPWVFKERIKQQNRAGALGELAVIYDQQDRFLAVGLYDPHSSIAIRVLHTGAPCQLDDAWWEQHFFSALELRQQWFGEETTGYRCLNGESEGWPGLVLDRYADHLVMKLYCAAWLPRLPQLIALCERHLAPQSLTLRLSRNIQEIAAAEFERTEGPLFGEPPQPVLFTENGVRFEADVVKGQKTGFFLDQRENRQRIESLADQREVLNAFSFSGGFSVYAARGGARRVVDLDLSQHALESAKRNFALNAHHPRIARAQHESIQADAFQWMEHGPRRQFDLIVCDPPSLAKRETERATAAIAYQKLNAHAMARLRRHGILVAASCSAHVSAEEFFSAVRRAVHQVNRRASELWLSGHPCDHPAKIPEARYLKCLALQFD